MDQIGVSIIDATSKAKRLKAGIGIGNDAAPDVVVDALDDGAGFAMDDQSGRPPIIADDAIGGVVLDDVRGNIGAGAVDKPSDDIAGGIDFGDGV